MVMKELEKVLSELITDMKVNAIVDSGTEIYIEEK